MDISEMLAALIPRAGGAQLQALVEQAEEAFKAECNREDVPEAASGVIARMVQHLWGQLDGAGLQSQSYSGASESFMTDWPESLKRAMHRYRKAVFL